MNIEKNIGNRIKEARISLGVSQKELASDIGVTPMTLYRYESGQVAITVETLGKIASALEIPSVDMLFASDEKFFVYKLFHFSSEVDYESPTILKLAEAIFEVKELEYQVTEETKEAVFRSLFIEKTEGEKIDPAALVSPPPYLSTVNLTPAEKKELEMFRDYLIWKRGRD